MPAIEFDERKIDALFAELNQGSLAGAAVGIAHLGKPIYRKAFGVANMELPVLLSPATRIPIASVTKHFTALAYMLLCEEGLAEPDDPVGRHLPELHPIARSVTMRQLMGHVSGLRDVFDISWNFSGAELTASSADLLSLYRDVDDVNTPPGQTWRYNNGGYLLVGSAVERISDRPLEAVLRERVFEPAGMYDTLLRRSEGDFVAQCAARHLSKSEGGFRKSYIGTVSTGEGGVVSTVDDMLRWLRQMDTPVVGSHATWQTMRTPQTLTNGTSTGYGFGLIIDRYRGVERIFHSGGMPGVNAQMIKVPSVGLDVVILVNRDDVSSVLLGNKILDACLAEAIPEPPATDPKNSSFATGTFRSPTTGRVIQLFRTEGKQIAAFDGADLKLVADEQGVMRPEPVASWLKWSVTRVGDRSRPRAIHFSDYGNVDELLLQESPQEGASDGGEIMGSYRSDATHTTAVVSQTLAGFQLRTLGQFGSARFELQPLAPRIWRANSMSAIPGGGILSFNENASEFRFSTSRTRALPFRRVG